MRALRSISRPFASRLIIIMRKQTFARLIMHLPGMGFHEILSDVERSQQGDEFKEGTKNLEPCHFEGIKAVTTLKEARWHA